MFMLDTYETRILTKSCSFFSLLTIPRILLYITKTTLEASLSLQKVNGSRVTHADGLQITGGKDTKKTRIPGESSPLSPASCSWAVIKRQQELSLSINLRLAWRSRTVSRKLIYKNRHRALSSMQRLLRISCPQILLFLLLHSSTSGT